ncbi:hypothetical protein [Staphylococcus simulans]|uniref:hypothetical protein n=1 Tax=Staphylococcus simulans TaxID=1286 RepID=UPI0021CF05E4|nr:hypothetical protein [Staphylococcus simulans]UXV38800.1 hypothetical protein MUA87_12615 [Staphylococcus simulans]UXV41222.1 hypothetical protein MUA56_12495 [Staphylococcus simulans]
MYTKTGKNATQFPNASPSNYFGFTREGRDQGIEAGKLVAGLHESKWMKTEDKTIGMIKQGYHVYHGIIFREESFSKMELLGN